MPSAPLDYNEVECPYCEAIAADNEFHTIKEDNTNQFGGTILLECPNCKRIFQVQYEKHYYCSEPYPNPEDQETPQEQDERLNIIYDDKYMRGLTKDQPKQER